MYSKALILKLNYLDFLLFKGQSHDKAYLCKNVLLTLYDAVDCGNILQIRETGFTSRALLYEKS
jgi:hypothetical protein